MIQSPNISPQGKRPAITSADQCTSTWFVALAFGVSTAHLVDETAGSLVLIGKFGGSCRLSRSVGIQRVAGSSASDAPSFEVPT